jgi:hypothetical protein
MGPFHGILQLQLGPLSLLIKYVWYMGPGILLETGIVIASALEL